MSIGGKSHALSDFLSNLPNETIYSVFDELCRRDLLNLAITCSWIYRVFKIYSFGFAKPKWEAYTDTSNSPSTPFPQVQCSGEAPPAENYRDCVLLDGAIYLVILASEVPVCWVFDFKNIPATWSKHTVTLRLCGDGGTQNEYQPLKRTAVAVMKQCIYIYDGESLDGEPTDVFYELDPRFMVLRSVSSKERYDAGSSRMMHSLTTIGRQHFAVFGGRCRIETSDEILAPDSTRFSSSSKFYDTKDFLLYDFLDQSWHKFPATNRQYIPYARSSHSALLIGSSIYIYGGQRITNFTGPDSEIHDDEDLWEFSFKAPANQPMDEAEAQSANPTVKAFESNKWKKILSPRSSTSPSFPLGDDGNWIETYGKVTGRRCGAAMFSIGNRLALLGGYEKDNWSYEQNVDCAPIERPWEMCKLFLPERRRWDHIRVEGFPRMECMAFVRDHTGRPVDVFILGRGRGKDNQALIMGWIRDT